MTDTLSSYVVLSCYRVRRKPGVFSTRDKLFGYEKIMSLLDGDIEFECWKYVSVVADYALLHF